MHDRGCMRSLLRNAVARVEVEEAGDGGELLVCPCTVGLVDDVDGLEDVTVRNLESWVIDLDRASGALDDWSGLGYRRPAGGLLGRE